MKKRLVLLAGVLLTAAAIGQAGHGSQPVEKAQATLSPPQLVIQFGRMGVQEMAKAGTTDADTCTALPASTDVGYSGNGVIPLITTTGTAPFRSSPLLDRLNTRYNPSTGTNPWSGYGAFGGTVNTEMLYEGVSGDPGFSQRSCGAHMTKLHGINEGSILYPSWQDLAYLHSNKGFEYVGAGNSPGGNGTSSPYEDGTWTDVQIANNILNTINGTGGSGTGSAIGSGDNHTNYTTNSLGSTGHGFFDGEAEMAWPEGPPGCYPGGTSAPQCSVADGGTCSSSCTGAVRDAGDNQVLTPDEVARRMAQGCVNGASHNAYSGGTTYTTDCDMTYSAIVSSNRKYSTNSTSTLNTNPWTAGPPSGGATGNCLGTNGEVGCFYARTLSLVGGKCTSTTDACHSETGGSGTFGGRTCTTTGLAGNCYMQPSEVITTIDNTATAGGFYVLQPYRFVEGAYTDTINSPAKKSWNCNGTADTHWTDVPETYCLNDFLTILDEFKTKGFQTDTPAWLDQGRGVLNTTS